MCSSPALIYGAHRVLDDKRFCRLWPQQPRNCVKDLKDVLKQRLGTETIQHHYCNNEINISVWTVARESWPLGWGWRRGRILYMREEECLRCSWWGGWWCQCLSEQILRSVFECHSADTWWIFPANDEKNPLLSCTLELQKSIFPLTFIFTPVCFSNMNILTLLASVGSPTVVSIRRSSSSAFCLNKQHLWTFCRTNKRAKNGLDVLQRS